MKPVIMFMTSWCPFCKKAAAMIEKLKADHPEYRDVDIQVIDEEKESALADQYDYHFVPTFFVGGVKVHEGIPTKRKIKRVFKEALK